MSISADRRFSISLEEALYDVMFSLLLCLKGVGLDEGSMLFRIGLAVAVVLFAAKILIGRYSVKELLVIVAGIVWGIFVFVHVGSFSIFIYALMVLGMKNVSVQRVMKLGAVVWSVCFMFTVTAALFFDRTGVLLVHEKLGLGPVLRESLGYSHPNVLHVTYIVLMAFVLYACDRKSVWKTIALLLIGDFLVFMYSMSYTGLLISFGMIVVYLYFTYRKKLSIGERILITSILPLCVIASVLPIVLNSHGKIYQVLNLALNNRVWAIKVFFDQYEVTLWGQKIIWDGYSLDNSYIYALAWYGILFVMVVVFLYWQMIRQYLKEERRKELAIVITFLIAGLTEQFLFNASIKNITFVFVGEVLFSVLQQKDKELTLAGRWNRRIEVSLEWCEKCKQRLGQLRWKRLAAQYIVINVIILSGLLFVQTNSYHQVYVNEKMCDCGGELVSEEEIQNSEDTLVLGEASADTKFYYFTEENSNFIQVMDGRYKISLSVYLSVPVIALLVGMRCIKCKK